MKLDLEWDPALNFRWGSQERLCGIRVFYAFRWRALFPDERTQFKRGQALARTVIEKCPESLTPALLLTRRKDVDQGFRKTATYLLFVVNIDEWRSTAENPAYSYLADHLAVDPQELKEFADLSELGDPEKVRAFVSRQLDVEQVAEWLGEDTSRLQRLTEIVDFGAFRGSSVTQTLDALGALGQLSSEEVQTLTDFVTRLTDADQRADLFRGATQDEAGRRVAGVVLRERVEDRVADARDDLSAYQELLAGERTTETDMQRFLAEHPLLFGLEYASIRPQTAGPSGAMDFVLERFDGYNDLVELKGPGDKIIKAPSQQPQSGVPSPHNYKLSSGLSQALAQAMAYRDRLTRFGSAAEELHGIPNPREPRLLIVLGRQSALESHQRHVLQELNRSLHRAEIIPYDLIASRAEATLTNIVTYLGLKPEN
jgi:hypothetical protein